MRGRHRIKSYAPEETKDTISSRISRSSYSSESAPSFDNVHFLQRTIGNHAVQKLFKSGYIQAKLKIGQPNDTYEQEADRVSDQVMRMTEREGEGRRVKGEERQGGGQRMAYGGLKRDTLQLKPG